MPTSMNNLAPGHIPIVGQAVTVVSYLVAPTLKCQCEQTGLVTLAANFNGRGWGNMAGQCPACGRGYFLKGFTMDAQANLIFTIEMVLPQSQVPAPDASGGMRLVNPTEPTKES